MASIRLDGIAKDFGTGRAAVREVDLAVENGEFLVLVGPSGCGKSTLLRIIAGLESPTTGRVWIDGTDMTDAAPQERDLAMVFQSYALYPHMTVWRNLAYGLEVRRVARDVIAERVTRIAERLGIAPLLDRRPAHLSGGERQRVALGRALVRQPRALLLDEPLSNLDPALRARARTELRLLDEELQITTVYVTHDQEEAMTLGHRVAVMRAGRVEQVASPLDIYHRPINTFVATFVGSPAMNLVPPEALQLDAPAETVAGIRPHDLVLATEGGVRAMVELVEPRGHDCLVHLRLADAASVSLIAVTGAGHQPAQGASVGIGCPRSAVHLFRASDGTRV